MDSICNFAYDHYNHGTLTIQLFYKANIRTPVALFSSSRDWFANPVDVSWLKSQLSREMLVFDGNYNHYSHVGFIWSAEANQDIYLDVLVQLRRFNNI